MTQGQHIRHEGDKRRQRERERERPRQENDIRVAGVEELRPRRLIRALIAQSGYVSALSVRTPLSAEVPKVLLNCSL